MPAKAPRPAPTKPPTPKAIKLAKTASPPKAVRPAKTPPRRASSWKGWLAIVVAGVLAGLGLAAGILFLDARAEVRAWRVAKPADAPVTVWSAPIRLHVGDPYAPDVLREDLLAAGYEATSAAPPKPGQFAEHGDTFVVTTAALPALDVPAGTATIRLADQHVAALAPSTVVLRPTKLAVVGDLDEQRTPVTVATVSPNMTTALLAIEDSRFDKHHGVDPIGVLRALLHDLRGDDLHGGSTLTQQLAKNLFLTRERTLHRKVHELFLALALESEFDKEKLLDLYLSNVYLGSTGGMPVLGVEQASRAWFGKSSAHLDVDEAATIAGAIASPNVWSPIRGEPAEVVRRRNTVIDRMVATRALSVADAARAKAAPLDPPATRPRAGWRLPWVVDAALDEAADRLEGAVPPGARVYSTVQPHLQRAAEHALDEALGQLAADRPEAGGAEGALVAVDVSDGDVVAIVGGRDWVASPFHRALRAERAIGSTVKPLLLAAALEAEPTLSLTTSFDDAPIERRLAGKTWRPKDHDGRFLGPITLRRAIELSRNVPMVLLSERLGLSALQRSLRSAGLTDATSLPSAALGAFPSTTWQLAGAYTLFPGGGVAHRPHVVGAILGADGDVLLDVGAEGVRVVSAATAALATSVLEGVLHDGTARKVASLGVPPAGFGGKTGTTDQGRDAWFVGFDARLVVATWVGADRGDLGVGGGEAALPVWAAFVRDAGRPRGALPVPDGVVDVEVCATSRPACGGPCEAPRTERFRAGYVPACDEVVAAPPVEPVTAAPDVASDPPEEPREAPAPSGSRRLEPVRRDARPRLPQRRVGTP